MRLCGAISAKNGTFSQYCDSRTAEMTAQWQKYFCLQNINRSAFEPDVACVLTLDLPLQTCTWGNAFSLSILVLSSVKSILPRHQNPILPGLPGWSLARVFPRTSPHPPSPLLSPVHYLFASSILVHSNHMPQP